MESRCVEVVAGPAARVLETNAPLVVVATFNRVVNLASPEGRLVAVHGKDVFLTPMSLSIDSQSPWSGHCQWCPGMELARVPGALVCREVVLDLTEASIWHPGVAWRPLAPSGREWLARLLVACIPPGLQAAGAGAVLWGGGEPDLTAACRRLMADLSSKGGAIGAACDLVGMGPGLTPAGDDVLVGMALAAWSWLTGPARDRTIVAVEAAAEWARTRSTVLGAEFLHHAARGDFSQPLLELANAAEAQDVTGVFARARTLVEQGGTSGVDTLTGMVMALQAAGQGCP